MHGCKLMRVSLFTSHFLSVLVLLAACSSRGAAQNVVFSAAANTSKLGVNDQLQVTYTLQDIESVQSLTPGHNRDFKVLAGPFQSQSTNMQIVGNRMIQNSSISFTFVLQPRHTGAITIPPAVAKDAAGHAYQSNALSVEIGRASCR